MNWAKRIRISWAKNAPDIRAALTGGFPRFVLGNPSAQHDGIPVFCYHRVTHALIEADLNYLMDNQYNVLSLPDFERQLTSSRVETQAVLLTVDDGAWSLYNVMFPALKKYNVPVTAFIAPGIHQDHYDGPDYQRPCTWDEIKEMADSGLVSFQSHTWSHRYIPRWPQPLDLVDIAPRHTEACRKDVLPLRDDLALAREIIAARLGRPVEHLAFPMYQGTEDAIQTGTELGYRGFWWGTLSGRRGNQAGDPLTHIPRISAEYIQRLPGRNRLSRTELFRRRRKVIAL